MKLCNQSTMVHCEAMSYTRRMKLFEYVKLRGRRNSGGFTLLEVLLAACLFSVVGMMATGVFLNLSRGQQQVSSRNTLYDDAQFILDQLTKEIGSNAIDYEEYYNRIVVKGKPGMNYGQYAAQFYYDLATPKDECPTTNPLCVNVGTNPSIGNFPEKSNAFYKAGVTSDIFCSGFEPIFSTSKDHACVKQLYLINPDGTKKFFIAPEKIDWDVTNNKSSYVLSRAMMVAYADANGNNSIPHLFRCETNSLCKFPYNVSTLNIASPANVDLSYPDPDDLKGTTGLGNTFIDKAYDGGKNFVPFTPSRVNIKYIKFLISPTEDPHKAFAEMNGDMGTITNIHQPKVTVVLTVEPLSNAKNGTNYPSLTVQTTVTPGLFTEVMSYPPQMVKKP